MQIARICASLLHIILLVSAVYRVGFRIASCACQMISGQVIRQHSPETASSISLPFTAQMAVSCKMPPHIGHEGKIVVNSGGVVPVTCHSDLKNHDLSYVSAVVGKCLEYLQSGWRFFYASCLHRYATDCQQAFHAPARSMGFASVLGTQNAAFR